MIFLAHSVLNNIYWRRSCSLTHSLSLSLLVELCTTSYIARGMLNS